MHMLKGLVTFFIISLSSHAYSYESVQLIEVFVNKALPVQGPIKNGLGESVEMVVYDLSGPERYEEELSKGINFSKSSHEEITNTVLKRVNGMSKQYMEEHVIVAYKGLLKATDYQITKIPAIVFNNGQSVIYGITDINKAIKIPQRANQ